MNRAVIAAIVAAVVLVGLAFMSAFTVREGHQALVLRFGQIRGQPITQPGLYFRVPVVETVEYIDRRVLGFDPPAEEVIASDQVRLVVDTFARFRIVDPVQFYIRVNNPRELRDRLSRVMTSRVREVLGNQDSGSVISGERAQIMNQIRDEVNRDARELGVEIVDVRIRRADFPDTISNSIFARMRSEREREARENRAQGAELGERVRADADRQRTILLAEARRQAETLRGEGDAARTKILADATGRDPDFYAFYRSLQAYTQSLQPSDTTMVLSPDSEFFRFFAEPPLSKPAAPR
jgi:membrane protease subunit HflC